MPSKAHCRFFVLCVLARCLRFVPAASRGGMLSVCCCLCAVCEMRCASLAACAYLVTRPSTSRPYPPDADANQCHRSNWVVADERLAESPRWNPQCSLCKDAGIFVGQTFPVTKPFKHFLETFIIATTCSSSSTRESKSHRMRCPSADCESPTGDHMHLDHRRPPHGHRSWWAAPQPGDGT